MNRREYGLERFVPTSLVEAMKRKELRKLLSHFFKVNQQLTAPGQKQLTVLQAKLHYFKIIAELSSYGAKCFSTNFKAIWKLARPDYDNPLRTCRDELKTVC